MRNKIILLIIILLTQPAYSGVEATLSHHYLYPGDNLDFHIEIEEPFTGTADLKFCLADFDFNDLSYNYRCDIFLERYDITFDQTYSNDYSIPLNVQPLIYRLFVQLHYEDKYHKDSDSDNFIYVASSEEPVTFVYNPRGIIIQPMNIINSVEQGSQITNTINITSYENCSNYYVYTYVYENNNCVTGDFNENMKRIELPYSSTTTLIMNNTIDYNATIGDYYYKIRVSGCGRDYDYSQPVRVIEKQNPYYNITINESNIIIKNYDNTNLTYEVVSTSDEINNYNGVLSPHTQAVINLQNKTQYVTILLNNLEVLNELLTRNELIINKVIVENNSVITGNITLPEVEGEKRFYILSLLTSVGALTIMYRKLR